MNIRGLCSPKNIRLVFLDEPRSIIDEYNFFNFFVYFICLPAEKPPKQAYKNFSIHKQVMTQDNLEMMHLNLT
jgi:hypothetical protein